MSHVEFDGAAAYPEIAALRAALARRDWTASRAVLDAAEPALRTRLIQDGAERDGIEDFLRYVLGGDPDDSAAAALLGYHLVRTGWKIRTGYRAQHVAPVQMLGGRPVRHDVPGQVLGWRLRTVEPPGEELRDRGSDDVPLERGSNATGLRQVASRTADSPGHRVDRRVGARRSTGGGVRRR